MQKRTTINDLAKALGLSPTLISMVLNGKGTQNKISPGTQKKVLEAATRLNYTPNQNARALRTGKTNIIGLIVPDISNAFYARLARRFEDLLSQKGYRLVMGSTDENEGREQKLIRLFTDQDVDGIISASTLENPAPYIALLQEGKAVVLFDRVFSHNIPSVSVQNEEGAVMAVNALVKQGKKKIGYMCLSPDHISPLRDRFEGYKTGLKQNNIRFSKDRVCEIDFNALHLHSPSEWLAKNPDLDAIITANNPVCFQLLTYFNAHAKERKMPAIVSFDDHQAFEFSAPAITSLAQPTDEIAQQTVNLLLKQLEQKEMKPSKVVLPLTLVLRQSHK